ncbi:hypothetical protein [Halorubrum trueperi]|uniref:DUF8141 domain-containing protein n=1 Tax=Halorubrum trueperi TaxID=2004704 RepID=A0ABD5UK18_9EURY
MSLLPRWFEALPFQTKILVTAFVFDPIGFVAGYLLGPSLGVEPIIGGVYGFVAASVPMSLLVMREASAR